MKRSIWLAAMAMAIAGVIASLPGFAQDGGRGDGRRAGGLMSMGAFGGDAPAEVQRVAEVEMEGGQRLKGEIGLKPLTVESDLGRYSIPPDKIKMIRFLKPPDAVPAANIEEAEDEPKAAMPRAVMRRGMPRMAANFVQDPLNQGTVSSLTRGKVITATGKEIIGNIYIPTDFKISLEVGTLYLAAGKLRTITFTDARTEETRANEPTRPEAAAVAHAGQPAPAETESSPTYFRQANRLIVSLPGDNRVALYNLDTKSSQKIELSASMQAPVEVTPISVQNFVALGLKGSKINRIAVADLASGTWYVQDLRQPVGGRVSPILGPQVAVYPLGRYVYAYSARAHRWDVVELPENVQATPAIGPDGAATIQAGGHIFLFSVLTGKWDHIDVRAILDSKEAEKK
jgi:hypothetical protein